MTLRNRISVNVVDETRAENTLINSDSPAVYVIGFMGFTESSKVASDEYFKPIYCDSISTFTSHFGASPALYGEDIAYWEDNGKTARFSEVAFPSDKNTSGEYTSTERIVYAGKQDIGWVYAMKLLQVGLPVIYEAVYDATTTDSAGNIIIAEPYNIYRYMAGEYVDTAGIVEKGATLKSPYYVAGVACSVDDGNLANINEFNIRFITSGGLPILEYNNNKIATYMINLAEWRGDCISLLDHTNYKARPFIGEKGLVKKVDGELVTVVLSANDTNAAHSAIFTPWGKYSESSSFEFPASYGYLLKYSAMLSANASWMAVAGVNRGIISGFTPSPSKILTNNIADILVQSSVPINAITNIYGYGQTISGNNTIYPLTGELKASQKLNIQVLVSEVVKAARKAAVKYLFEQNSTELFFKFKSDLGETLDKLVTGHGLKSYKVYKDVENTEKDKLAVIIKLYTVYAVEAIQIGIRLNDEEVEIEEF